MTFRDELLIEKEHHRDSVLLPFLFITVLKALSKDIKSGCLEELLYVDEVDR